MDIEKMLSELRSERAAIEEALIVLERIAHRRGKRGRIPKWMSGAGDRRGTFVRTPEMRARMAEGARRRWAKRRRAAHA